MPLEGVVLDHAAVAVEAWAEAWPTYVVGLGGEWASGGLNAGFGPAQLRYANGARLEVLQPWRTAENPFLRRFLDRHGRGPHHLTFKVPDISEALEAVADGGFTPVSVDLSDPSWKEAFLHPREAGGIVVQLAEAAGSWEAPAPEGFPSERPASPASLLRATHAVADLQGASALYGGILGGSARHHHVPEDAGWDAVTFHWSGPLALRLVSPTRGGNALRTWLDGRPGRLHHLVFAQPGPRPDGATPRPVTGTLPGVLPDDAPVRFVVEPGAGLGTRLVVQDPPTDAETPGTGR